jgi:Tfp pilus tip-associated adhesin PilY1
VGDPWSDDTTPVVWRLGDVINSKPILVSTPAESFDLMYGDASYAAYKEQYSGRRQMAYFGANDGLLHAINVGFYGSLPDGRVTIKKSDGSAKSHDLGAEVWAFAPTAVLPHLRWLPDPKYSHSYYVDLKPQISDIKINGEWRTVLFGGLRLGGRPIEAPEPEASGTGEHFYSEIFALDITDPEQDPVLLWRFSALGLGLTTGLPSIISQGGSWYAVLPSGPVNDQIMASKENEKAYVFYGSDSPYDGFSNQKARLFVLDAATGYVYPANNGANYLRVQEDRSFFNNPFLPVAQKKNQIPWDNHAVYFGLTVSRNHSDCTDKGAVYRLQTVDTGGNPLSVAEWQLARFFSTERPVTGEVNSAIDPKGNLWVVFGTGRLWSSDDITPCLTATANSTTTAQATAAMNTCKANHTQYIFGIKEELVNGFMTFKDRTPEAAKLVDLSGARVTMLEGGGADFSIVKGLPAQATNNIITVTAQKTATYSHITERLQSAATIGYKKQLNTGTQIDPSSPLIPFEMVITQPKILAVGKDSVMGFTSFEPEPSGCGIGSGYLNMVDTFTGLPSPGVLGKLMPLKTDVLDSSNPDLKVVTASIRMGDGVPTGTFIITSTGFAGGARVTGQGNNVNEKLGAGDNGTDGSGGGSTAKICAVSSTGQLVCLPPISLGGGTAGGSFTAWREVLDSGFRVKKQDMTLGLSAL